MPKRLFFEPELSFFSHLNTGAVFFKPIRRRGTGRPVRTAFSMQILGQMADGSVRLRLYEGDAQKTVHEPGTVELAARRCYIFGKRYWEDRMRPLDGWTCDHLVFRLRQDAKTGHWISYTDERSSRAAWFGELHLSAPAILQKKHYFSGRLISVPKLLPQDPTIETPDGLKPAPLDNDVLREFGQAELLVWGKDAGLLLRDGQKLDALDKTGRRVGQIRILSRPGDTVLARWVGSPAPSAVYAYTQKSARKNPGLLN